MTDDPLAAIRARAMARMVDRRREEADRAERARKFEQSLAELRDLRRRQRRAEESLTATIIESRYQLQRGRSVSLDVAQRYHRLRLGQRGCVMPEDAPYLDRWRRDVEMAARTLGVTIRRVRECAGINAYA